MRPLELAKLYLDIVFLNNDFDQLYDICSTSLRFVGPLFRCETSKAYVDALKEDPPQNFKYKILKSYEDHESACIIYQFSKPGTMMIMMQMFEITDGKISGILLLFDTKNLT